MISKLDNAWKEIEDAPIYIVSQRMTLPQIMSTAEMLHATKKLDIMYLDHIQYIAPLIMPHMSRNDTLSHYSLELAGMAKRLNIPIVVASQLNRDAEKNNRKPRLSDLRDSGALEADARQVLLLYWDNEAKHHWIEVAKNNYGVSGEAAAVQHEFLKNRFAEVNV